MEIADEDLVEVFVSFDRILYRLYRLIMPLDVQIVAYRLSVGSESIEDQGFSFLRESGCCLLWRWSDNSNQA